MPWHEQLCSLAFPEMEEEASGREKLVSEGRRERRATGKGEKSGPAGNAHAHPTTYPSFIAPPNPDYPSPGQEGLSFSARLGGIFG